MLDDSTTIEEGRLKVNKPDDARRSPESTDASIAAPEDLVGAHYEEMIRSQEAAMVRLSAPDDRIRLGAILICEQQWRAGSDVRVLKACRSLAESQAGDSIRIASLDVLGRNLSATKDPVASRLVARMVLDSQSSPELRLSAYYVLREIYYGVADVDFDSFMRGTIHAVKTVLRHLPSKFSEESVRNTLLPEGGFPADFWDSADQIDLDFVGTVLSELSETSGQKRARKGPEKGTF